MPTSGEMPLLPKSSWNKGGGSLWFGNAQGQQENLGEVSWIRSCGSSNRDLLRPCGLLNLVQVISHPIEVMAYLGVGDRSFFMNYLVICMRHRDKGALNSNVFLDAER